MKWLRVLIIIIIFSCLVFAETGRVNYCHDKESWEKWEQLVKKYPSDVPLQILHALRIGLCTKIEDGSINYDEAVRLMNDMMDSLVGKRGPG